MSGIEMLTQVRPRMGTLLAVSLPSSGPGDQMDRIRTVFDIAGRLERLMSRYDAASDLSRLNARAGTRTPLRSAELAPVLRTACELSDRLNGAFDPTVAPVLDLWRRAARRGTSPSPTALRRARSRVGAHAIRVTDTLIVLERPGMSLDLGALGKGLALDEIAATLRRDGCRSGLLNFGESSLLAIGRPPGRHWRVVLRDPFGGFAGEFALCDRACSTSATLGQRVRIGGRVFGHIIDPRTGHPLRRAAQVTVLARSAAVAEAVSTALLVLGRHAVNGIAARMAVDVCWIDRDGIRTTPWFLLRRPA